MPPPERRVVHAPRASDNPFIGLLVILLFLAPFVCLLIFQIIMLSAPSGHPPPLSAAPFLLWRFCSDASSRFS